MFDQGLRVAQAVEDFAIKQSISHPPVEAFAISARFWLNVGGLRSDGDDPVPDCLRNEIRAIVRADEGGTTFRGLLQRGAGHVVPKGWCSRTETGGFSNADGIWAPATVGNGPASDG